MGLNNFLGLSEKHQKILGASSGYDTRLYRFMRLRYWYDRRARWQIDFFDMGSPYHNHLRAFKDAMAHGTMEHTDHAASEAAMAVAAREQEWLNSYCKRIDGDGSMQTRR
jgi:hypothetical protein